MPLSLAVGFSMVDLVPAVQHVRAGPVGLAAPRHTSLPSDARQRRPGLSPSVASRLYGPPPPGA